MDTDNNPIYYDYNFSVALAHLKIGSRAARKGWNGKGMYLELQEPDEHSKMTRPYIYISTVDGERVPWLASQTDLLSQDWAVWTKDEKAEEPAEEKSDSEMAEAVPWVRPDDDLRLQLLSVTQGNLVTAKQAYEWVKAAEQ